jgi:hypothetical protein
MSKRSIIIIVLAAILIIAAIVSVKADFQPKSEAEPEPEPGQEKFSGGRKGFYYDRNLKRYIKAKGKTEPEGQKPASSGMVEAVIVEPGVSDEVKNP